MGLEFRRVLFRSISKLKIFTYNEYALELLKPLVGVQNEWVIYVQVVLIVIVCFGIGTNMLKRRGVRG